MAQERYGNLVAGEIRGSHSGETVKSYNPADTRQVLGEFPVMAREEVVEAIEAAAEASPAWRKTPVSARSPYLLKVAELFREQAEQLARDITREVGKTVRESRAEVTTTADLFAYYAGFGLQAQGANLPGQRAGVFAYTQREPVGVVGLMTPWSDPLLAPARKLAPALISGNTAVVQPSEDTPLATHRLASVMAEAGLPAGVVNTVTGDETKVVDVLLEHPSVQAISFTGSTKAGKELVRKAADRSELRVQTEMGAKNAALVLDDADIEKAADAIVSGALVQGGQHRAAISRVVVVEDIHEPLMAALIARVERIRVGNGLDNATDLGPLVHQGLLDEAVEAVEKANAEGATVVTGGFRLEGEDYDHGYFFAPTVLDGVAPDAWVARKEILGPVLCVITAKDLAEGIDVVNNSAYGLSASVFTRSLAAAHHFAENVEAGNVSVNLSTVNWGVHLPFGGVKDSGSPFREQGAEALQFYTRLRTVAMDVGLA